MFDLLLDDPIGHGVDVEPGDITAEPVGLYEWSAAAHEWIGDLDPLQTVCLVKGLPQGLVEKFGKQQASEQRPGSSGKPFVDGDNRPVVLLNLLFTQGEVGYEGDFKIFFYHNQETFMAG